MDFGSLRVGSFNGILNLIRRHAISTVISWTPLECAKIAHLITVIGVVNVGINVVIAHVAMHLLTDMVG